MRFIPSFVHAFLDYLTGFTLIAAPWLFGFSDHGTSTSLFIALGIASLVYSFFTDYELGVVHILPFRWHLVLDFVSGFILATAPAIFGYSYSDRLAGPHLAFGLFEMGVAVLTNPHVLGFREVLRTRY